MSASLMPFSHRRGLVPQCRCGIGRTRAGRTRAGTTAMPLTVLNIGYALAPVGPDVAGGAEQVLSALDHALVAAGHRSIVVAPEGSQTAGALVATAPIGRA